MLVMHGVPFHGGGEWTVTTPIVHSPLPPLTHFLVELLYAADLPCTLTGNLNS